MYVQILLFPPCAYLIVFSLMRPNRFLCCSCKSVFPDINKTGWIWIECRVDVNPASQAGVLQLPTSKIWMCFYHADCLESQGVEHIVAVCPQNLTSSCGCVNKWRLGISRGHLASCKSLLQVSPFRLLICSKKGHFKQIWIHGYSNNWKVWDK